MGIGVLIQRIVLFSLILGVVLYSQTAFAQDTSNQSVRQFTTLEEDEIQNNPTAQEMLDKIEESKRIIAKMMDKQQTITEHQKFIEQQRELVQQSLQAELDRINKKYEDNTPRNAFARFVANFNTTHHGIYWDQFEYMESKINLAKAAKQQILDDGGSFREAQDVYLKYAAMPRGELIQKIVELNIKYGFANQDTQQHFDQYGKLPRFENDEESTCYACNEFVKVRDNMFDKNSNPYTNKDSILQTKNVITISLDGNLESSNLNSIHNIQLKIDTLNDEMQNLGKQVSEEDNSKKQRILLQSITKIAQELEKLQNQL